jgi:hypothetical protein
MPDLSLLLGAAVFAAGMLTGRLWPARRKHPKPPKAVKPTCGCKHDLAHHEPDGNGGGTVCHGTRSVPIGWNIYGEERQWREEPCTCRQYTGARIIDPGYVARELTEG